MNAQHTYYLSELTGMCLDFFQYEGNYSVNKDESYDRLRADFAKYYGAEIKKALFSMGIAFRGFGSHVTSRYGEGDLTITIQVTNKTKLKKTIIAEKQHIQRALGNQRATWWGAENTVESELERLKKMPLASSMRCNKGIMSGEKAYKPDKDILGVLLRQKVDFGDADANAELLSESLIEEEEHEY